MDNVGVLSIPSAQTRVHAEAPTKIIEIPERATSTIGIKITQLRWQSQARPTCTLHYYEQNTENRRHFHGFAMCLQSRSQHTLRWGWSQVLEAQLDEISLSVKKNRTMQNVLCRCWWRNEPKLTRPKGRSEVHLLPSTAAERMNPTDSFVQTCPTLLCFPPFFCSSFISHKTTWKHVVAYVY